MSDGMFFALWGSAIGGAWLGVQIAPTEHQFAFGLVGFIGAPILVSIWEAKNRD